MIFLKPREKRRRYYRATVDLWVEYCPVPIDGPLSQKARVLNLCEDGLAMLGNGAPPPDSEYLVIKIPIPGRFPVFVAGQVLRRFEATHGFEWAVAICFTGIEQRDRDRIYSYLVREQRKQLRSRN